MKTFGSAPPISHIFKFIDSYRLDLTPTAVLARTQSCLKLIEESDIKSFLYGVGQLNGSYPKTVDIFFFMNRNFNFFLKIYIFKKKKAKITIIFKF